MSSDATPSQAGAGGSVFSAARAIEVSRRIRWDIDRDVLRGRRFDFGRKFMPDGLSKIASLAFLMPTERRFLSQVQSRTYANMLALLERFIGAKSTELARDRVSDDRLACEALELLAENELKHQELFGRLERMAQEQMPAGYAFLPRPDEAAREVLGRSTWAAVGLTLAIEISSQWHYLASTEPDAALSELWKDVLRFHWKEESQHAIVDELEWRRVDALLDDRAREDGVTDLIALLVAVDRILQVQAEADAAYFLATICRTVKPAEESAVRDLLLRAYRWQYIVGGIRDTRFGDVLADLTTPAQRARIGAALESIVEHAAR